ncbi:MAG: HPr(Ser) kinase/phosphatase [bacterium]|nr:HPr(Ser) kinase/phosphatase [bacterium]
MKSNSQNYILVEDLLEYLKTKLKTGVRLVSGGRGLKNKIRTFALNRPGITLSGFFNDFSNERVQLFGRGEFNYLLDMKPARLKEILDKFFRYKVPCCIFTNDNNPGPEFLEYSNKKCIPVIITRLFTDETENILKDYLQERLAQKKQLHGVMVEVFGIGILILGKSGVGKSESALELVTRGHRLIADDTVIINKIGGSSLIAEGHELIKYYLEIRGIGIVDIKSLFGVGAVREKKTVDLVVILEDWKKHKNYERIGLTRETYNVFGMNVPLLVIPVKPGRNIPVIIETVAKNMRLEQMGEHTASILNTKLLNMMKENVNEK